MNINSHPLMVIDQKEPCYSINSNQFLTASIAEEIRAEIRSCLEQEYPVIYLDAKDVDEVDLSGINEVIHSHYTLLQASKKLIFVYRKNSKVEKWVETTGLDKFIDTAIAQ
jgi:anti-anti-sigma regulatory factor